MEDLNQELTLGARLHIAETAIHAGREAIAKLLTVVPIDEAAIANERVVMHQARLERNQLRRELEATKDKSYTAPGYSWLMY